LQRFEQEVFALICSYPSLDGEKLDSLQHLEKELGRTLLAYSCHQMEPAQLTPEELERIQSLEKDLGVVIVAL